MSFVDFIIGNWQDLLVLTREHIFLVLISTGLAIAFGVPGGILLTRFRSFRGPVLGFANVMQTVPSLALFGLLIPIPFIGGIGSSTAIIALGLYALLPVIRNTMTGILGIDPELREASAALGMTEWQKLRLIETPLAMPVILTGIRVAVVISVGVATIAAAVGAGGLGTYIFRGLRQNDNNLLIAGALASALLALLCDFSLGRIAASYSVPRPTGTTSRLGWLLVTPAVFALLIGGSYLTKTVASGPLAVGEQRPIVVASKDFTESIILAEIVAQTLEKSGIQVSRQLELGGNIAHDGLLSGEVDVYPEYTGTAYTAILKHPPITDPAAVFAQTRQEYAERFDLLVGSPLGFSNDFAILVRGETARKNGLTDISDAVPLAKSWQAGFGQDFMSRADGYAGFIKAYGFNFAKQPREMDLSLTYRALQSGELDIIAGNSTDGLIAALDLVQLNDNRRYFPPYQGVFIFRKDAEARLRAVIDGLAGKLSTDDMRRLNYEVDGNKRSPSVVAAEWIMSKQ
jgi:osmoprotectant transport system permease protein